MKMKQFSIPDIHLSDLRFMHQFTGYCVLLMIFLLAPFVSLADGVGFGSPAGQVITDRGWRPQGTGTPQMVYVYLKAGENLLIQIERIDSEPGVPQPLNVNVFDHEGIEESYSIAADYAANTSVYKTYTAVADGIWTVLMSSTSSANYWRFNINARTSGNTRIAGRVFTEKLLLYQSAANPVDVSLYHVNHLGHQFQSAWYGFMGIDGEITTNIFGNTESSSVCAPLYKSRQYPFLNADCGRNYKQFFVAPDATMPASALRYDLNNAITVTDWLLPSLSTPTITIGNLTFTPNGVSPNETKKGIFSASITGFDQIATLLIDANNNGSYTDAVDRSLPFLASSTSSIPFDGLDGMGNPISCYTNIKAKVLVNKGSEIHFKLNDVEALGGLTVIRLNGVNAPNSILYWDDTDLADRTPTIPSTPILDGTLGVNSNVLGGVHGWTFVNNAGVADGWGNDRSIDNWATFPIAPVEEEISISSNCPIDAVDDDYRSTPVSSVSGTTNLGNILENDTLYGYGNIPVEHVIVSVITPATPNSSSATVPFIDPLTGIVNVPEGTPSGEYKIVYRICDVDMATNCDNANVWLTVNNPIVALDDNYGVVDPGSTTASILVNDSLGHSVVDPSKVSFTPLGSGVPAGLTLNPNGTISVGNSVAIGDYTFDYKLCEINAVPENCDIATVTLSVASAVPVSLASLNVNKGNNKTVALDWATASEHNNKGFEIQRAIDSKNWESIGFVNSLTLNAENATSNAMRNYLFIDEEPLSGQSFYRLKQIDFDGGFEYSSTRTIWLENERINVAPNPARENVFVSNLTGNENVFVYDLLGNVVFETKATQTTLNISFITMPIGIYNVVIIDAKGSASTHKVIKSN